MTRRGNQALLAISFIALLGSYANAQSPVASQLQSSHSILTRYDESDNLNLPKVQFQRGRLSVPHQAVRRPRQITPEMASILAPPAQTAPQQARRIPTQIYDNSPHPNNNSSGNFARQTRMGYNPYATHEPIRQVVNTSQPDIYTDKFATPVFQDERSPLQDPFAVDQEGSFPALSNPEPMTASPQPLTATQDPENPFQLISSGDRPQIYPQDRQINLQDPDDPFQQRPKTDPRSGGNPATESPPRANPDTGTQPRIIPQDPDDPFQQRPGMNQQDTSPRPLPNDLTDPTQLPIPPRDRNVLPREIETPTDPANQEDGKAFIYPNEAYPGQQTYPGPTAAFRREQPQGQAMPSNTSQIIYPPSDPQPVYQGQQLPLQNIHPNFDPVTGVPIHAGNPGFSNEYQQVIASDFDRPSECRQPDGWRPQLALADDGSFDEAYDPNCFQPLFYLAGFGGLNSASELDGGQPGAGNSSVSYQLEDGASFGLAFGQYQGQNLRTEIEYTYRNNDLESLQLAQNLGAGLNLTSFNLSGEIKSHSGMANIIWQFDNPGGRWVNPYVGAGAGFVFVNAEAERAGRNILVNGADGNSSFAYQLFAGINTQLSSSMDVFVEYRYFAADELRLHTDMTAASVGSGIFPGSYDYATDNIHFGMRFKF